ncbi:MSHA biogenesis protein MshA [Photobacterium phosphoreum]|uniref:type II secretion system protein n=1 Tax=Photobacterium phosphoreum TaxID=659 RepID=UPI000D176448|nr:prepilin-type N-terminal cleavage/methylation domain-containing protein [Photobacterium phosphoreum]PSW40896.1 MSHA biogenesis protein MshA [Photobacterium phosphoreum]
MQRQNGFTLIELVVVIVILGILAVTAAPKFLNLQDDARASSLQGLKGAIDSAAGIVYGKAAIAGAELAPQSSIDGVYTSYGYPRVLKGNLESIVMGLANDWHQFKIKNDDLVIYTYKGNLNMSECIVTYTQATSKAAATTVVKLGNGCTSSSN